MQRLHMTRFFSVLCLFTLALSTPLFANTEEDTRRGTLKAAITALCHRPTLSGTEAQFAVAGSWLLGETRRPVSGEARSITVRLALPNADELVIERRQHAGRLRQFRASYWTTHSGTPEPVLLAIADGGCTLRSGRALRSEGEIWRYLDQLDGDLATLRWTETLQAPWPRGQTQKGIRVGLVDSGLAYDLPVFRDRLARRPDGTPEGYDFWDLDPWPYDGDVGRGPFLPIRHGTAVASVLAREAPHANLVPYRYPRPDMTRMGDVVAHAAAAGVRILAMPLGSQNVEDWRSFDSALAEHDMLAVVSAGNNGRDIDTAPIYPAALPGARILTVTSADAFGRLAQGSNWGAVSVDVMVPAENIDIVDFRGASGTASGSSYAVPRVAALAARILAQEPGLAATALKARILARAVQSPYERNGVLAAGWIPNPLED